jgi:hypothetical protein
MSERTSLEKWIVYLAMQNQLECFGRQHNITCVVIHRLGKRQWIPFIDVQNESGLTCTFSVQVTRGTKPRTWVDPRSLVDWVDMRLCADECILSLSTLAWEFETSTLE